MANVCYMMENYTAMGEACEKAILIDPNNTEATFLYARACIGHGDTTNAVAMLTKAISLKDDYVEAYLLRGETLLAAGETEEADADALWLLEHTQDNEDVLTLKARIERAKGNSDAAIDCFTKVIDANPFNIDAYRERGEMKLVAGDEKGGNEDIEQAAELANNGNGDADGENISKKVDEAYKNINPLGI
jgi:tetratricopeptide (TPR) repeat protein